MDQNNYVGFKSSGEGKDIIQAVNPATDERLGGEFPVATHKEVDEALQKANQAWRIYRKTSANDKAAFLRSIAKEIERLGMPLIERVMAETGLPEGRVTGERGRTCNQLRLFASYLEEGSWTDAIIDTANPERAPIAKPDIRKHLIGIGPVVVFTASNFPLAFSTAGGDTASALAAGCPVIVKAHESHPGTHALISQAIIRAARDHNMPDGVFSSLFGKGFEIGQALVQHEHTKAVAFTGSFSGGRALYDLAASRKRPIPVFAEMGSVNPIFLGQESLDGDLTALSQTLSNSVNLGAGQFCTNPGLIICPAHENAPKLLKEMAKAFETLVPATMLNKGIFSNYCIRTAEIQVENGVEILYSKPKQNSGMKANPVLAKISGTEFLRSDSFQNEVFGPYTLMVMVENNDQFLRIAENLEGQLTASLFTKEEVVSEYSELMEILEEKVGRLILNGVPTGVEVCHAMQHGGPFPSTTDERFSSVGTSSIKRFIRPISYQSYPDSMLPPSLKDSNPLGIWRLVDGKFTKDKI
jgi:NADP-dependent aldehyde dehydrogenase